MKNQRIAASAVLSLVVLGVAATPFASAAPQSSPSASAVKRYIVSTDSVAAADGVAADVSDSGGDVDQVYSKVFAGFSASLTARQAQKLAADGQVTSVVADGVAHTTTVQTSPTWGLDRTDQRGTTGNKKYQYDTTGSGVTAFVLDTGVRFTQTQFGGRATSGPDFVDQDMDAADCAGHGTHVSGIIGGSTYGIAKKVKIVSVRALDCEGSGYWSDIIAALDWIVAHKPAGASVVNLSIGGEAYAPVDKAVQRTIAAGIAVVVAAGNDGANACTSSPARVPAAITVAATDSHDKRATWSNYGKCVDIFAPGVSIRSASDLSNTASEIMSGTSMAAPHVTGVVARYLQLHPKSTPAQTATALVKTATTAAVKDPKGSANRLLYAAPTTKSTGRSTAKPVKFAVRETTRRAPANG